MGLMQLMPATFADLRKAYRLGPDPFDPHDNIMAGAAYLRLMYVRFGYPGLFYAYNEGPGHYRAYLSGGRPLPRATRDYAAKIMAEGGRVQDASMTAGRAIPGLFAAVHGPPPNGSASPPRDALFFVRDRSLEPLGENAN
jgi:soluble lytic murein transglycosylase-like protein